jgi:hypothetical protein
VLRYQYGWEEEVFGTVDASRGFVGWVILAGNVVGCDAAYANG